LKFNLGSNELTKTAYIEPQQIGCFFGCVTSVAIQACCKKNIAAKQPIEPQTAANTLTDGLQFLRGI